MGSIVKKIIHLMGIFFYMRTVDEILDKIIAIKGLKTDAGLSREFNVKPNTVTNWRKRNSIPYDYIVPLCEREGWSLNWLLTGQINTKYVEINGKKVLTTATEPGLYKKDERKKYPASCAVPHGNADEYTYIPQVNGKISAGKGVVPENAVEMRVAFRKEWIARKGNAKNMVLIKISGDSMDPTLLNGDLVLVDRGRNYFEPQGGIYAIALDDVIMIKRVQLVGDYARIISDNKMYEPFEVKADRIKINGKVIWFARELER
jgi:phage repressor protein C with HTH and peptisase S24 domain